MAVQNLYPFLASPVLLDATSTGHSGSLAAVNSSGFAPAYPPTFYNSNLYQILLKQSSPSVFPQTIKAFRSPDNGATWSVLDAAHAPTVQDALGFDGGVAFDGAHTLILAYAPQIDVSGPTIGTLQFINFDMATETWGAVYGSVGAPTAWAVDQLFIRPDGTYLVLYAPSLSVGAPVQLSAAVYNPATTLWSTFVIDANVTAGYTANGITAAAIDSATGNVAVFFTEKRGGSQQACCQIVLANNTAPAAGFAVLAVAPNVIQETQPAVSGANWVVGVYNPTARTTQVAVGTPLNQPVWTLYSQGTFDPTAPAWVFSRNFSFASDATGLYMAYLGYDGTQLVVRTAYTPNLNAPTTGWTGIDAFTSTDPRFEQNGTVFLDFFSIIRQNSNTFGSGGALAVAGGSSITQYWFGGFAPAVVTASTAPYPFGGAGGGAWCCPQWRSNHRMMAAALAVQRRQDRFEEWPYSSLVPPVFAPQLNGSDLGVQSVAVPAAGSTVSVLSYLVPSGFRLFLAAVLADFEGAFQPGDSLFTLSVNRNNGTQSRPVQGLTNLPVPVGSWRSGRLWEFDQPYEFAPLDLLEWRAKNVNLVAGAPNSYVAGLFGWLVPVVT